jgi:hypothetical protein
MDQGLFAKRQVMCVSAVIDTRTTNQLAIFNPTDEEITLYPEMNLGTCESTYPEEETEPDPRGSMRCARTELQAGISVSSQLPEHLTDLHARSSSELTELEKEAFAELLFRYQSVFAKSSEDLGRTDRIKHRINTGSASPCKQPPPATAIREAGS